MPKIPESMSEYAQNAVEKQQESDKLRPYTAHKLILSVRGSQATGDCPFCGRGGKFSVHVDTGLWRCLVCGTGSDAGGGNALTFLRLLWDRSFASAIAVSSDGVCKQLADDRKLLDISTIRAWGCVQSPIDRCWMVPGYDINGRLDQLYRRTKLLKDGGWVYTLLPTSGIWPDGKVHALHMSTCSLDSNKPNVDIFEGPWDGMTWWEVARQCRWDGDGRLVLTGSEASSLVGQTNVVAVPGCGTFRPDWIAFCRGKNVTIWYDSDHPRDNVVAAGWNGARRVAAILKGIAKSVKVLCWGPDGYDPSLKSGFDVRDCLSAGGSSLSRRIDLLSELYKLVVPVPDQWATGQPSARVSKINGHNHDHKIEPRHCDSWRIVEDAWIKGMRWRQCLGDVLSVALAVAASNDRPGDQLFLQMIGDAGCLHGNTTIYDPVDRSAKTVEERYLSGNCFNVWSKLDDGTVCIRRAMPPCKYTVEPMYRVTLRSGRQITVTAKHRFWDGFSFVPLTVVQRQCGEYHLPSISESVLQAHEQGVLRLTRTVPSYQCDCFVCSCLCDGQPQFPKDCDPDGFPLPFCAHERSHLSSRLDGLAPKDKHNQTCQLSGRHSMLGCQLLALIRRAFWELFHSVGGTSQSFLACIQFFLRIRRQTNPANTSLLQGFVYPVPTLAALFRQDHFLSCIRERSQKTLHTTSRLSPLSYQICTTSKSLGFSQQKFEQACDSPFEIESTPHNIDDWDSVVNISFAGNFPYYDFHVPGTNNYMCEGVFHHNSGKSRICQAMLTSSNCYPLRHMTGFHSGSRSDDGRDLSLIARINNKTLITPEGDVMMSSPKFIEIMSQARQIFDGESGSVFKTTDDDKDYKGLRTPWIMAGTPALLDYDQSRLGDRFIRVYLEPPNTDERRAILDKVSESAFDAMFQSSADDATMDVKLRDAYALTGGYIDYLRANMEQLVSRLDADRRLVGRACADLAEFTADMRARPNPDIKKLETNDAKEMPTRLTHQYVRLSCCLAVVLNKKTIDNEVLRIVRKVAFDTSRGRSLDLVRTFHTFDPRSKMWMIGALSGRMNMTEEKLVVYLNFLAKIGVVEHIARNQSRGFWKLTDRVVQLYEDVIGKE